MSAATPRPQPLEAIAGFAALLRDHGLKVGIAEQQAMVRAALAVPVARARVLDPAWRAIACHDARDWRRWPELFERYWHPERLKGTVRTSGQTRPARDLRQVVQQLQDQLGGEAPPATGRRGMDTALDGAGTGAEEAGAPRARGGASRTDALHDRSLAEWLPQDLSRLELLAERIARRLRERLTRRWRDDPRGARLDVRRTLRASLRTGGLPLAPAWRRPRREKPRVFILVDVSRSMETHAQLFLRIARAFVRAVDARVFVFHTRLAEVTPLMHRDSARVQEKINAVTAGFGGGTRIAACLNEFAQGEARAQLGRHSRVWVVSDGFDTDAPDALADALRALRRRGARIAWFHPTRQAPLAQAFGAARDLMHTCLPLAGLPDLRAAQAHIH